MMGTVRIAHPTKRRSMSCAMCAPCPARASVMGPSVHAWHPVHLHTVFAHTHRLEPEIDRYSRRGTTAVDGIQARGDEVHRPAHADSGGEPGHGADRAEVPEGQRADIVLRRRGHRGDHELLGALLHVLGAPEEGVPAIQVERTLQYDAARERPQPNLVVRTVDQAARPRPLRADGLRGQRSRADSVEGLIGMKPFGTLYVCVPGRQTPTRPWIDGQPRAVGIEPAARVVEVRPILVRLPAVEPGGFELRV